MSIIIFKYCDIYNPAELSALRSYANSLDSKLAGNGQQIMSEVLSTPGYFVERVSEVTAQRYK